MLNIFGFIEQLGGWGAIIVLDILAVLAIIGLFDKTRRERKKEIDEADDRLINLLKQEIVELTKRVDYAEALVKETEKRFAKLETENSLLKDILKGRDESSQTQKKMIEEIHNNVSRLVYGIEQLVKAIEKRGTND